MMYNLKSEACLLCVRQGAADPLCDPELGQARECDGHDPKRASEEFYHSEEGGHPASGGCGAL